MQIRFSTAFIMVALVSVMAASLRAEPATTTGEPAPFATPDRQPASAQIPPAEDAPAQDSARPSEPPGPTPPAAVTVISSGEARGILGREIRSAAGEDMGRIVDVIVDRAGQVRAAVIDFGGFLGVGSRKIVVDWAALWFGNVTSKDEKMTLAFTRDQVRAAPEYKDNQPIVVLAASGSLEPLHVAPAGER